jgi:hypothetical protein
MSSPESEREKIAEIADGCVRESAGDYVGLWQISTRVRNVFGPLSNKDAKVYSLAVVHRIVNCGLRPGDYLRTGFRYWSEDNPEKTVARIDREWGDARGDPTLFDPICWFDKPKASL